MPGIAAAQNAYSLQQDAAAFGARESITSIDLSPDGNRVAYIAPASGGLNVALTADLTTKQSAGFLKTAPGSDRLRRCTFVTNDRLICRYSSIGNLGKQLVGFRRLIAINRDGSAMEQLGQSASAHDAYIRQFDGTIVDWLPESNGWVLMARQYIPEEGKSNTRFVRTKQGVGVDRVNTLTLKSKMVEPVRQDASGFYSDGHGNVRLMSAAGVDANGYLTGRTKYSYRTVGSSDWRQLSDYAEEKEFQPLAIDAASNSLYVLKPLNGRKALYRIKLLETPLTEFVASHPRVDIDDIVMSSSGRDVIGYSYVDDRREVVYLDPQAKALMASLSRALKDLPILRIVDTSTDGSKVLVFAGSDRDPGRYYLFNKSAKTLTEIMLARPELENRTLSEMRHVSVKAPDGAEIPAYLTLPAGKPAANLPAVVLPHGGPSARDEWGFDWIAQFLAARGYAVLQPNYRGSAGYGDAWLMHNGFKSWRTSIGDITASAKWLASQGIADPNRLAVVGWSYGGYAALQSAVTEPSLFKAVAAVAPVTDLGMLKGEFNNYSNTQIIDRIVGSGAHVDEGSPLRHAAAIRAPVLLVHGDKDENVGVDQSARMAGALREKGTPVEFVRFEGLDHYLDDSAARSTLLAKVGALLERTIGK
jgi:dipeptidyl aminopeptidase/acylaminoacyl peptidase